MSFSALSPLQINLLVCGLTFPFYVHDIEVGRSELLGGGGGGWLLGGVALTTIVGVSLLCSYCITSPICALHAIVSHVVDGCD